MEDVLTLFGQRLKELRKAKKLTQKELADLLEMTDRNYQRLEYGKINVSATVLVFLADFFHVTTDYRCNMERIRLIDPADPRFGDAFALYEISFPVYERRTRAAQAARLSHPEYHFDLLMEGERFLGILLFWEADGFRYVEHFATCPQLRGQGVGTRALAQLNGEGVPVVLEIDLPRDEVSIRRQHFYERCGFFSNPYRHVHPPYRAGCQGHPLVVMTSPAPASWEEYDRFAAYLGGTVMEDCKIPLTETEE